METLGTLSYTMDSNLRNFVGLKVPHGNISQIIRKENLWGNSHCNPNSWGLQSVSVV
jgi:hypothetical protein